MKEYCQHCGEYCEQNIEYNDMQIKVNEDDIWILGKSKFCSNCGEENYDAYCFEQNMMIAKHAYEQLKPLIGLR